MLGKKGMDVFETTHHNAINYAPVVFHEGGFLVFGGFTDSEQVKTIAKDGNS